MGNPPKKRPPNSFYMDMVCDDCPHFNGKTEMIEDYEHCKFTANSAEGECGANTEPLKENYEKT